MTTSNPIDDPLDRILAEIAIRIQLPPSRYDLACQRYQSVAEFAERPGSPLKDRITRFYPQGSMAITLSSPSRPACYARSLGALFSHSKHARQTQRHWRRLLPKTERGCHG